MGRRDCRDFALIPKALAVFSHFHRLRLLFLPFRLQLFPLYTQTGQLNIWD